MNESQKKKGKVEDWIERDITDKGERRRGPGIKTTQKSNAITLDR
jgi:hypothetical protein